MSTRVVARKQTMRLPRGVVVKVLRASEAFEAFHEELEDYLMAHHPALVKRLRKARREHLAGHTRPFVVPQ